MIPRLLHFVWVGGVIPPAYAKHIAGWRDLHPGWGVRLWAEDDLTWLQNQELFDRAEEIAPGSEGQFRSDVARYEILHRHGGVYLDCDIAPRKPLDDLSDHAEWACWEVDGVWVNNAAIGAHAGSVWLTDLIGRLPGNVRRHRGKRPNHLTGPRFITRPAVTHGVHLLPSTAFYPYLWNELHRKGEDFPDSYGVHHWGNARKRQGAPL